jgi:hypothetical protein
MLVKNVNRSGASAAGITSAQAPMRSLRAIGTDKSASVQRRNLCGRQLPASGFPLTGSEGSRAAVSLRVGYLS